MLSPEDNGPEQVLDELVALIANDAYAISFQTFGQYRTALLKAARDMRANLPPPPTKELT